MKKWLVWLFLLALLSAGMAVWFVPKKIIRNLYRYTKGEKFERRKTEPVRAIFDWNTKDLKANTDSFQYLDFRITDSRTEIPAEINALDNSLPVFITVDMWNNFVSENPLESIVSGRYDERIREICGYFSKGNNQVFIRWNPEMEVPANIYPWQGQSPLLYNEAFKYFSNYCKKLLPRAKIVWSTAGYPGVLEYFPGDEVIDYVSVTLQSPSEKATGAYPGYRSVSEEIVRKIHRMRFLMKPVFILDRNAWPVNDSLAYGIEEAGKYIQEHAGAIYETSTLDIGKTLVNSPADVLKVGVYDPNSKLKQLPDVTTEHVFPNLADFQNDSFHQVFNAIVARKHHVIVTFEPWRERNAPADPDVLLSILNGRYDDQIRSLFSTISKTDQTVYLRWTHEMEIPVTRYPWQSQPPVNYIKAYRYVASFRKPDNKNIKLVWGPAGDRGLQDWWPGSDVVDLISMAIYGLPDKNITDHKQQESFKTIFNRKIYRMRFFDKPIFITEFGIKGPEDYKREWLLAAAETIRTNPEIMGVSYFNMVDSPKAWGDIEAPDWSISPETFRLFVKSLTADLGPPVSAFQ